MLSRQTWFALSLSLACFAPSACVGNVDGAPDHAEKRAELEFVPIKATPIKATPIKELVPITGGIIGRPVLKQPDKRVIFTVGFRTKCPVYVAGSGWVGGDMFPLNTQGNPEVVNENGQRFCAYVREAGVVAALPQPPCVGDDATCVRSEVQPDRVAVYKQGSPETLETAAAVFKQQFNAQLRVPESMPSAVVMRGIGKAPAGGLVDSGIIFRPRKIAVPAQTLVYVLDDATSATAGGEHGQAVMRIIRESACPAGACGVEVVAKNVFTESGAAGSAIVLAQQLVAAVNEAAGRHAVINASVGVAYEQVWEIAQESTGENGVIWVAFQAVKAAINYASYKGVPVIAAIGNRDGGTVEATQPRKGNAMYPGKWSNGESGWTCKERPEGGQPWLLHGAGAVRADGRDSPGTRPNGQALLVAPGYTDTLDDAGEGKLYWEGSSFSSAALSAVVAATWSYMPTANGAKVMETVYAAANPLGRNTGLCRYEDCPVSEVRQCNSVLSALKFTCALGEGCPSVLPLRCHEPAKVTWPALSGIPAAPLHTPFSPTWTPVSRIPGNVDCGAQPSAAVAPLGRNARSCPFKGIDNGQPREGMHREPGNTPCPPCRLVLENDKLVIIGNWDKEFADIVGSPALRVKTTPVIGGAAFVAKAGETVRLYELGDALETDDPDQEVAIPLDMPIDGDLANLEAVLEFTVTQGGVTTSGMMTVPYLNLTQAQ